MIQSELLPIDERISAPITWDVQMKFKIQDLRENRYDEAIRLIKHHYFREEPMCRSSGLVRDSTSLNAYISLVSLWLKDESSLVAVSRKTDRVVGVLVSKINSSVDLTNTYSRVQIYEGETLKSIMDLKSALIEDAEAYEKLECERYFRVYILCVHPSYKHKPVARCLLEACLYNALHLKLPIVAGVFTSNENQLIAQEIGMTKLTEIPYNNWLLDNEVVFDDPGIGNYSAMFMYMATPDETTLEEAMKTKIRELAIEVEQKKKKRAFVV